MFRGLTWICGWAVAVLCWGVVACGSGETTSQDAGTEGSVPEQVQEVATTEPQALKSGSLVVVSYNVHGLPSGITQDDTNARLKTIGPMLNTFDIAGLQEVFTEDGYNNLITGVNHSIQHRFNQALENRAYGAGLLLLSKVKAVLEKHEYYDHCNGTIDGASDCLASKGFHMVRYALAPGVEVDVYNSHFEAGNGDKDMKARADNLIKLRDAMLAWSKGRALIFLGDTNLKQTRPSDVTALKDWADKVGLVDSCEAVNCPEKGRIDRVFFRDGERLSWQAKSWRIPPEFVDGQGKPLSDHEPIVVTLSWQEIRP